MPERATKGRLRKRSVIVSGHRTSISLEQIFWEALRAIGQRERKTINELVSEVDRGRDGNLSSAIRVFVLGALIEGRLTPAEIAAPPPPEPPPAAA